MAIALAVASLGPAAGAARAQDFAFAAPGTLAAPASLLEHALPDARAGIALTGGTIAWFDTPGLLTRAVALDVGRGAWRGAAGVSQTGEPAWGWTTVALGAGACGAGWSAGGRVLARRDRLSEFALRTPPGEGGLEAGAGASLGLGAGLTLWTSAPGLVVTGAAPPLARALETGLAWRGDGLALWLAHRSSPAGYGGAGFAAGVAAASGPARVWLTARDAPLAGGLGVALARGRSSLAVAVDSHPWLPPTTRLAVVLGSGAP